MTIAPIEHHVRPQPTVRRGCVTAPDPVGGGSATVGSQGCGFRCCDLRPEAMVALPVVPDEAIDARWVERMRGPYTSRARHLLERALATPAHGRPPADRHHPDPVPTWAREAAACQRGLLDALGMELPLARDLPAGPDGPVLVQHLVPAIALGWYLVTTVHATGSAVVLVEGAYTERQSDEAPCPVRWS